MNFFKRFLLFTVLFVSKSFIGFSQFNETIFYDTISNIAKNGYIGSTFAEGKYLYLSGSSFGLEATYPTVTKMDTSGQVLWTAVDNDNYQRFGGGYTAYQNSRSMCRGSIKAGNQLFSIVQGYYWLFIPEELWCISDTSSILLWKKTMSGSIVTCADYSNTELLVLTASEGSYDYHVIDKQNGNELFVKNFGSHASSLYNNPNILVDAHRNILLSWDDKCRKFRDNRLNQLLWTSNIPYNGSYKMIDRVVQDSGRYIFLGMNNVRSVDTLTGSTVWFRPVQVGYVQGSQSGGDGNPKDCILKDSLFFITWVSPYVGGVDLKKGFTLTCINKYNGTIRYNVAQTFTGVPPHVPFADDLDWPAKICMSANMQIYMTGSYDYNSGPENPGNWGIMKLDWRTGSKIYEATITVDPSTRMSESKGLFLYYLGGKMYCTGNLQQPGSYSVAEVVSFDTTSTYNERYRISPDNTFRYPSSLAGISGFGTGKMLLLKQLGRSAIIEMRNAANQLIWSKTYSTPGKFIEPQAIKNVSDSIICASFLLYSQNTNAKILKSTLDSIIYVKLDPAGNSIFRRSILMNPLDTIQAETVYSDPLGKTNFIYLQKTTNGRTVNSGKSLNVSATRMGSFGFSESTADWQPPRIRINNLTHYFGDTAVHFSYNNGFLYVSTQSASGTYGFAGVKGIQGFSKVYSSVKLDSVSFFITGQSPTGSIKASKYNFRVSTSAIWSQDFSYRGSMYNADTSKTAVYGISEKEGKGLYISKIFKKAGNIVWNTEKTLLQKKIVPIDFMFNQLTNKLYIAGYVSDSTFTGTKNNYFLHAVDSSGNVVRDLVRQGYGLRETAVNGISTLDNGTVIYGGRLSTMVEGTVGFYISDCYGALNYTFTGTGNWNVASNWANNLIPPAELPDCSEIFINPAGATACILNVPLTIASGARLTVMAGKTFIVMGNLTLL